MADFQGLSEKIRSYLSIPDDTLRIAEQVGALVLPFVTSIRPTLEAIDHIRLSNMLIGLRNGADVETRVNELKNYVSSGDKAEYVGSLFRQCLLSTSPLVNTIIGLQLAKIADNQSEITQINMVIYDALSSMNDFDLKNYVLIYKSVQNNPLVTNEGNCIDDNVLRPMDNFAGIKMTIHKCSRLGLLDGLPSVTYKEEDGMSSLAMGSFFKLNPASDEMYRLINEATAVRRELNT